MVDIAQSSKMFSIPDRRLLASLTQEPALVKYLENLGINANQDGANDFELLLSLIIDVQEQAGAAQSTANRDAQDIQEMQLSIQVMEGLSRSVQWLSAAISEVAEATRPDPQMIQALKSKIDEIEVLLLEIKTPIFPAPTPSFAPSVVTVSAAYPVASAPSYQPLTVRASAVSSGFTVTLPASPQFMQLVNIKKIDATANIVTVSGGAITIDGSLSASIASQYTNIQVQYNGTTWDVL